MKLNLRINLTMRVLFLAIFAVFFSTATAFAAPPNTMPINRAQIRFVTANVSDAGSDDYVKVYLNGDNRTWVESYADDFKQGSTITYDLRLDYVTRLSDLDYLKVEKTGDDGWCIKQLLLIINGRTIYSKVFPGNGLWLDNSGGQSRTFYINDTEMRTTAEWTNFISPFRPPVIPVTDVRSRIESAYGDFIAYDYLLDNWGDILMRKDGDSGYGVDLYPINPNTWRVDLDAEEDLSFGPNPQIDIDFNLSVACANGRPTFTVSNLSPTPHIEFGATDDRAAYFVQSALAFRLNEMMKNFTAYGNNCYYMNVYLSSNGDLNIKEQNVPVFIRGMENSSPINLQVDSQAEATAYEPIAFSAIVTNTLTEDTEAEISFDLSSGISPLDAVIEAKEGKKIRQITMRDVIKNDDGSNQIIFRDNLRAGKNTEYIIRVMFQPQENRTEQIITRLKTLNEMSVAESSPIEAATDFQLNSDNTKPE